MRKSFGTCEQKCEERKKQMNENKRNDEINRHAD